MNDSTSYPHLRVQDLAAGERPQERLERLGAAALSDAELLAMLLRTGSRGHNVLLVAQRLISEGGSLAALTKWTESDFRRLTGIGRVKALQLVTTMEIASRVLRQSAAVEEILNRPEKIHQHFRLQIIGLTLAGGLLLLWVAWRMYRELRSKGHPAAGEGGGHAAPKTPRQAMIQIIVADISMSLDNVLAVAGAARDHKVVLWIGLGLSVVLMAVASNLIARILDRHRWVAWIGFLIVLYVAADMIWEGTHEVVGAVRKA